MDHTKKEWVKAKLIGLTILKGQIPLFEIVTDSGALFSNVPPHKVCAEPYQEPATSDDVVYTDDLVYFNSPSETFSMCVFDHLAESYVYGFDRKRKPSYRARYICSIDFYQDNNWCHMILRDDGFFGFIPSHKLLFKKERLHSWEWRELTLPDYKKLRREFKL
jgi:hypothetical protein